MNRNAAIALKNQRIEELSQKKKKLSETQETIQVDLDSITDLITNKQNKLNEALANLAIINSAKKEIFKCSMQDTLLLLILITLTVYCTQYIIIIDLLYIIFRIPKYRELFKITSSFDVTNLNETILSLRNDIIDDKKEEDEIRERLRELDYRLFEVDADMQVQNDIKECLTKAEEKDMVRKRTI